MVTVCSFVSANAQTDDKKAVMDVVNKLFAEMRAANAEGILATGTADNQLVTIRKTKDGKSKIDVVSGEAFTKFFTKADMIREVMYDPKIEVVDDWAMVWGRYVFYVNDKISHCGINQFNLVRTDNGWKIANGASTIDQNACTEKEKKMKITDSK